MTYLFCLLVCAKMKYVPYYIAFLLGELRTETPCLSSVNRGLGGVAVRVLTFNL